MNFVRGLPADSKNRANLVPVQVLCTLSSKTLSLLRFCEGLKWNDAYSTHFCVLSSIFWWWAADFQQWVFKVVCNIWKWKLDSGFEWLLKHDFNIRYLKCRHVHKTLPQCFCMYQNLKDEAGDSHAMQPLCQVGLPGVTILYTNILCVYIYICFTHIFCMCYEYIYFKCRWWRMPLFLNLWRQQEFLQFPWSLPKCLKSVWTKRHHSPRHLFHNMDPVHSRCGSCFPQRRGRALLAALGSFSFEQTMQRFKSCTVMAIYIYMNLNYPWTLYNMI